MSKLQQLMLDHGSDLILVVDAADLRIIEANRRAIQVLGYAEERLLSMQITEVESSLQDVFYWEDIRNGQWQEIDRQEGLYQCADGELRAVIKAVRVAEFEGRSLLVVVARDKQGEQQIEESLQNTLSLLRATLESTGNGIIVLDWQAQIINMNRQFSAMWHLPEHLLMAEQNAEIIAHMARQTCEPEAFLARLQAVVDREESNEVFHLLDGRVVECRSRPQYLAESIVGRVYSFDDITQRTLAEIELRESRDRLEDRVRERTLELETANSSLHAEQHRQQELIRKLEEAQNQLLQSEKMASMGQLAAGVAHEINNPVGFVNSNLGTLQRYVTSLFRLLDAYEGSEKSLDEAALQALAVVKKETDAAYLRRDIKDLLEESLDGLQRVKRIVQDLKDFSHVDRAELEWADLETGLDSTLNVVWNELKYKAKVIKEYGHPPAIECLPSQLNQVFMNLLVNAAHAIESTGEIRVRTGFDADHVWVEVSDTGRGIPPDNLKRIFEPFFTTKPVGKGTGLGLSLAYGIVKKHQGTIEVTSVEGQGSRFRVVLPNNSHSASHGN